MIKLESYQVCPFGSFCEYSDNDIEGCQGLNSDRPNIFICELWAENYEIKKELED